MILALVGFLIALCVGIIGLVTGSVTDGAAARHAKPSHPDATNGTAEQRSPTPPPSASRCHSGRPVLGPAVRARLYASVVEETPPHMLYLKM